LDVAAQVRHEPIYITTATPRERRPVTCSASRPARRYYDDNRDLTKRGGAFVASYDDGVISRRRRHEFS
jgi:hypothetical protein